MGGCTRTRGYMFSFLKVWERSRQILIILRSDRVSAISGSLYSLSGTFAGFGGNEESAE